MAYALEMLGLCHVIYGFHHEGVKGGVCVACAFSVIYYIPLGWLQQCGKKRSVACCCLRRDQMSKWHRVGKRNFLESSVRNLLLLKKSASWLQSAMDMRICL